MSVSLRTRARANDLQTSEIYSSRVLSHRRRYKYTMTDGYRIVQRSWYKQELVTCVRYSRSCPPASAVTRTPLQLKLACSSPHIKLNYYITSLSLTLAPQNDQHLIDGLQCEVILPPSRPHPSLHYRSHLTTSAYNHILYASC